MNAPQKLAVTVGSGPISLRDVVAVARGRSPVKLDRSQAFQARLSRGADAIAQRLQQRIPTYGVNTGFGAACENAVPAELAAALARNLPSYHGCGVGPLLSEVESRAVLMVRMISLGNGFSGVRAEVLSTMAGLLNAGVSPCIPERGSVGASGDLTPLSYVAAVLMGEREAWCQGRVMPAEQALRESGIEPVVLGPKESLAIMNGTSVMAALMSLSLVRAHRLARFAARLTAMAVDVMQGQPSHFDERIFEAKAHPGQAQAAAWTRADLGVSARPSQRPGRIQDRYSLRCAPHVLGVLLDALPFFERVLETEVRGASDNPLIDPDTGDVLHGGNFYGGHVAMVADTLKTCVANVADLLDRQLVMLNHPQMNNGLPGNLVAIEGQDGHAHHGFKAMEITASSLTAEALKLTMPASVFSRSTEGHNQDKVSMGTHAARDCRTILELTETVAAVHLLALCQAVDLRGVESVGPGARELHAAIRQRIPFVDRDRRMDSDIETVLRLLREEALPVGEWQGE